ncbi:MAG TPA: NUDIX domain-containing protein [Allosphingosinicella sp.]
MQPPRILVRTAVTAFQSLRRAIWFVTRPEVRGVLALPLTPEGKIVLVRLTYDKGWHLPGGGLKRGEDPQAAILRELREEIGLQSHGAVTCLGAFEHRPDRRKGRTTFFRVEDVRYAFKPSLEIEELGAFAPDALPPGTTQLTAKKIAEALG